MNHTLTPNRYEEKVAVNEQRKFERHKRTLLNNTKSAPFEEN